MNCKFHSIRNSNKQKELYVKGKASELGTVIWYSILALIVLAMLFIGITALSGGTDAWYRSIDRNVVQQSKSFTDANNSMLETYKLEYTKLDTKIAEARGDETLAGAYKAQQAAILSKMCQETSTMSQGTINPSTASFLQGQCK